jgi:NhaP-type Na+/H+ or K+/H+ antiporter
MSADSVLYGVAVIVVLGVGSQWIARRLNIAPLLLLLPAGLVAGDVLGLVQPLEMLGDALFPVILLLVALLLFQAGLQLRVEDLPKRDRGPVARLVIIGGTITFAAATGVVFLVLQVPIELAFIAGAVLVVSGPTVVGPLLRAVNPRTPIGAILNWESTTLDPIGAVLGVAVLNVVVSAGRGHANPVFSMILRVGWGLAVGLLAAVLLVAVIRAFLVTDEMEPAVALLFAVSAFTVAESVLSESGLVATVALGLFVANQRVIPIRRIRGFGETLEVLIIGSLFITLGALVTVESLVTYWWSIMAIVAVLVLVVRPVAVAVSMFGSGLPWQDRAMIGWVAPRGIVAAATAAQFSSVLVIAGFDTAFLLPVAFGVVLGTGVVYGLTAKIVSGRLGVRNPPANGVAFLGVDEWIVELARGLWDRGIPVLLVTDGSSQISDPGIPHMSLSEPTDQWEQMLSDRHLAWAVVAEDVSGALEMTTAFCIERFGRRRVLTLSSDEGDHHRSTLGMIGLQSYPPGVTKASLMDLYGRKATIVELESWSQPNEAVLAVIRPNGQLDLTPGHRTPPRGSVILGLVDGANQQ